MPDGTTGYTRDGSFQVDANGQLVTNNGYAVQPGITIPAGAQSVTIAPTARSPSPPRPGGAAAGGPDPAGQLHQPRPAWTRGRRTSMPKPRVGRAAGRARPGSNGLGSCSRAFVEGSNVNVVEELVAMIATQRAYELNSKAIQTSDQMLQRWGSCGCPTVTC
jgi:flagellar basal-body rod protein FlgG